MHANSLPLATSMKHCETYETFAPATCLGFGYIDTDIIAAAFAFIDNWGRFFCDDFSFFRSSDSFLYFLF